VHTIKRIVDAAPDVAPSMPSYDEVMGVAPRVPPMSAPARVFPQYRNLVHIAFPSSFSFKDATAVGASPAIEEQWDL
jgi:hypothetical protein